jgi:hypothetical protein
MITSDINSLRIDKQGRPKALSLSRILSKTPANRACPPPFEVLLFGPAQVRAMGLGKSTERLAFQKVKVAGRVRWRSRQPAGPRRSSAPALSTPGQRERTIQTAVTLAVWFMALFELGASVPPSGGPVKRVGSALSVEAQGGVALLRASQRLADAFPAIVQGRTIHYATAGDWAAHDLVLHVLGKIGPAHVTAASWSISEPAVRQAVRALLDGRILSLRMLLDWRVPARCPEALQLARANAATLRLANLHAKVTVLTNSAWSIAIVGSANWTNNPRIEAGVLTADRTVAEWHRAWIEAELSGATPFDMAAAVPPPADSDRPRHVGYSQRRAGVGVMAVHADPQTRKAVIAWKMASAPDPGGLTVYAEQLAQLVTQWAPALPAGCVVTCPPQGASAGGFYYAEALAASVAKRLGVPMVRLLSRTDTKTHHHPMAALAQTPFTVHPSAGATPAAVVVIDDLITSGQTMKLSLAAIRQAGIAAWDFAYAGC